MHRVTSVGPIQLVSRSFGVAAVLHCRAPGGACHDHLVATEDLGRTWTDITPKPLLTGIYIYSVFFLDPQHGWVIAGSCEPSQATTYRTVDGGRRWHGQPTDAPDCHAGSTVQPEFVDPLDGWLIWRSLVGESTTLRRTTNGGHSWTAARQLVLSGFGGVTFTDRSHGWMTTFDSKGHPALMRSSDAGRTWTPVLVPAPACCQGWRQVFDLPVFTDARHGVLPIVSNKAGGSWIDFATTNDGGSTWRITGSIGPATLNADIEFPSLASIDIANSSTWWVGTPKPASFFRTSNGGGSWRAESVPDVKRLTSVQAIDRRRAWATGYSSGRATLYVTRDEGRTWRAANPVASFRRPATSAEIRNVLALPSAVTALTVGPDGILYAGSFANYSVGGSQQRVVRFDPSTGATTQSAPFGGAQGSVDRLAFAGDSIWVAAGNPRRHPKSERLYQLDGSTLAIRRHITMNAPPTELASVPAGLWVAAGKRLELLNPWTSMVIRTVTYAGHVQQMVASPDGSLLYVTTDAPVRHDATPLLVLDARTGDEVARSWQGFAELAGVTGLAATEDGVWVTVPTGMMATLTLLQATSLRQVRYYHPAGSNALRAYVAGPTLWVVNARGGYTCADPSTGLVRGYVGILGTHVGSSNVVTTWEGTFVGGRHGIDRIVAPPACVAP